MSDNHPLVYVHNIFVVGSCVYSMPISYAEKTSLLLNGKYRFSVRSNALFAFLVLASID